MNNKINGEMKAGTFFSSTFQKRLSCAMVRKFNIEFGLHHPPLYKQQFHEPSFSTVSFEHHFKRQKVIKTLTPSRRHRCCFYADSFVATSAVGMIQFTFSSFIARMKERER